MRYSENREQTAELLRMVLPMMSRHSAGFHPLSYAVWYEYAAGANQALKAAVDALIATGRKLGDGDIQELFDRHVAMRDIESSMRLRAKIQKVVEEVTAATKSAGVEVGRYNDGLGEYQNRLQRDPSLEAITELVHGLLDDTTRVLGSTSDLQQNLQHSVQEAQRLHTEMDTVVGLAQLDPLTGLLNRRGLEQHVASSYPRGLPMGALLRVEVNQFRQIVDSYGHLLGDRVLTTVAQLLQPAGTASTVAARDSGGTFLLLLAGATPTAAAEVAEHVRRDVENCRIRRQDAQQSVESVTVAIGTAIIAEGETLGAALARAASSAGGQIAGGELPVQ